MSSAPARSAIGSGVSSVGAVAARRRDPSKLTVADIESATGLPRALWIGDCFGISLAISDAGIVDGRPDYVTYNGPVHPRSPWIPPRNPKQYTADIETCLGEPDPRLSEPSVRRGLQAALRTGEMVRVPMDLGIVRLADGRVLDATRWTYEMSAPYVFVGPPDDYEPFTGIANWLIAEYVDHLIAELAEGSRHRYDGSFRVCQHDDRARRLAAELVRPALARDPWFRPFYDLLS